MTKSLAWGFLHFMIVSAKKDTDSKIIDPKKDLADLTGDRETSKALRPKTLSQYIGQGRIVRQLQLILDSAKIRDVLPEHILLYGQPGLGKTTLANLVASELGVNFKIVSAPSLQKIGDIVSLLINLEPKTVVFIDEIHRLRAPLEEVLYTAMEDGKVDLIMGKGTGATTARIDLEEFVLIGATTLVAKLSKPLRDRFPTIFKLDVYSVDEIFLLLERNEKLLGMSLSHEAKNLICHRSRGVPRIANNILKRFVDLSTVHQIKEIDFFTAEEFLKELGVFDHGLTKSDISYLQAISENTLGLKTISGVLLEDPETLENVVEPYLINLGFIDKNSSGRSLTPKGRRFLEIIQKKFD